MMGDVFKKLKLLLWKNWVLQKRHPIQAIVELVVPLIFTLIFVIIRGTVEQTPVDHTTEYPDFDPADTLEVLLTAVPKGKYVLYAPNSTEVTTVMNRVGDVFRNKLKMKDYKFDAFPNEEALLNAYDKLKEYNTRHLTLYEQTKQNENPVLAAVIFLQTDFQKDEIKYRLRFPAGLHEPYPPRKQSLPLKARWLTEFLYELFPLPRDRDNIKPDDDIPPVLPPDPKAKPGSPPPPPVLLPMYRIQKERGGIPGYWSEGFLFLQGLIDKEIIREKTAKRGQQQEVDNYNVKLHRFPYPNYVDDEFVAVLQIQFPVFIMLSYIYPIINIAKSVAHEKERRLKEAMKIMGLQNWLHWTAWFIKCFVFTLFSTAIMIAFYKIPWYKGGLSILKYADVSLLSFFFISYVFCTITLGFLVSTLFNTANAASTAAGVVFFLNYFPYFFLRPRYDHLSTAVKVSTSIFTNTAMAFGCQLIAMYEGTGAGIQWSNIAEGVSPEDSLTLLQIIIMLWVDGIVQLLLALYIESIHPGEYGIALPWYYPFTKWYWMDLPQVDKVHNKEPIPPSSTPSHTLANNFFEMEPKGHAGIRIRGLTKRFGKKVAVNNLTLNFYENQVTALLGHNGAGKTTTMSVLTGLLSPTSGTAIVNGHNIRNDIKAVRSSLGLCPQHDVLFDELTVEEHLSFFCRLKGVPEQFVSEDIDRILGVILLENKRHAQSHTLSGGMKRKLSVGIALIGGSKVVLLDEPTSGMDPTARRSTWDLITSEKKGRTIVLSTHFMDEADLLGDRIAIMAEGQAQCCGSSLFLKKKYGGGYHLIIVKEADCKVDHITELLQKRIPEVVVDQNIGAELSYSLPDEKSSIFPDMFEELEKRKNELGIASYGCSITQMEEVFMRVGEQLEAKMKGEQGPHNEATKKTSLGQVVSVDTQESMKDQPEPIESTVDKADVAEDGNWGSTASVNIENGVDGENTKNVNYFENRNEGARLLYQQFRAMMVKKWLSAWRNKLFILSQIFVPVLFVIISLILFKTLPDIAAPIERVISLEQYARSEHPVTTIQCPKQSQQQFLPICDKYKAYVETKRSIIEDQPDINAYLLQKSKDNLPEVNSRYIVGLRATDKTSVTGFFNNQPFHTPPLALNLISNAILHTILNNNSHTITVSNYPLPFKTEDNLENIVETDNEGSFIGFTASFGLSFLAASFVAFVIKERETKSKHLQFVSGVRAPMFWLAHFVFDSVNFFIGTVCLMITLLALQARDFSDDYMQGYFFLALTCYGFAIIPMMYLFSFLFTVPSAGYTKMTLLNFLTGMATYLTVVVLQLKAINKEDVANQLEWFFMIFPNFDVGYSITLLSKNRQLRKSCGDFKSVLKQQNQNLESFCEIEEMKDHICCTKYPKHFLDFGIPGIGRHLLYLIVIGVICFLILFLIESHILEKIKYGIEKKRFAMKGKQGTTLNFGEDDDVAAENSRIRFSDLESLFKTDNMVLVDLTKWYGEFLAVNQLCLGVKHGECFGLLGVNGAGKTTTFKMLTGDIPITAGNAYIAGKCVKTDIKGVQKVLGYCPQFDALIPELTGRETIRMFARLRGIQEHKIDKVVDILGEDLLFSKHMEKPCGTYSGGNKRKLSTALALVGNPPLVFLDEPTTGMDPVARRHLWNTIIKVREGGASVILTSHSMEECEALCTRLAIMVNGKFRCLGSTQHLKNKFGDGYILICQLAAPSDDEDAPRKRSIEIGGWHSSITMTRQEWEQELHPLRGYIEEIFPGSELKEKHPQYVHYHIKASEGVTWGSIFREMEDAKALFKLEAYSVGQTSLEQVFLSFTQAQT